MNLAVFFGAIALVGVAAIVDRSPVAQRVAPQVGARRQHILGRQRVDLALLKGCVAIAASHAKFLILSRISQQRLELNNLLAHRQRRSEIIVEVRKIVFHILAQRVAVGHILIGHRNFAERIFEFV